MSKNSELIEIRSLLSDSKNRSFIDKVKEFEGFRDSTYHCPAGVPTIGYGFTSLKYTSRQYMSLESAHTILLDLLSDIYFKIRRFFPRLKHNELLALTDFSYNLGTSVLFDKRRKIYRSLSSYYYLSSKGYSCSTASRDAFLTTLMSYHFVHGVSSTGLIKRRSYEISLFLGN